MDLGKNINHPKAERDLPKSKRPQDPLAAFHDRQEKELADRQIAAQDKQLLEMTKPARPRGRPKGSRNKKSALPTSRKVVPKKKKTKTRKSEVMTPERSPVIALPSPVVGLESAPLPEELEQDSVRLDGRRTKRMMNLVEATYQHLMRHGWKFSKIAWNDAGFIPWRRLSRHSMEVMEAKFVAMVSNRDLLEIEVTRVYQHSNAEPNVGKMSKMFAALCLFSAWMNMKVTDDENS